MFNGTTATDIDIMAGFKNKKFVIVDEDLGYGPTSVVLTDINFWADSIDELGQWIEDCTPTASTAGMTVDFSSHEDLVLFVLRWS